jgi:hypothetical protein
MSLETWKMTNDLDNQARLLGYWITHIGTHIGSGFLLYRFDEPRVLGEWFSAEKEEDLRARLDELRTFLSGGSRSAITRWSSTTSTGSW